MKIDPAVPILRVFDEEKSKAFYVGYLGFNVDWEHRFEPGLPLYLQVTRGGCVLHLTEHHGDCCPGAAIRIAVEDIDALHGELQSKRYPNLRPRIENTPWGTRDLSVIDPFGNRLTFTSDTST